MGNLFQKSWKKVTVEDRNQRVEAWVFINILTLEKQTIDWIRTDYPVLISRIYCTTSLADLLPANSSINY